MERLVIHKSRKKAAIITLAGFAVGIAGALFLLEAGEIVVGWCFVIAAAFTLIYGVGSLADRKPHLVLTPHGITDPFTIREEIDWEAIAYADDFFFRGQYVVRLLLRRNYKPDLIRSAWFSRFDGLYGPDVKAVYLRTGGLELNSLQLVALIRRMIAADVLKRIDLLRSYTGKQH